MAPALGTNMGCIGVRAPPAEPGALPGVGNPKDGLGALPPALATFRPVVT